MALKNKLIHNPKTNQTIKFLQTSADTNGKFLELEATFNGHSTEPKAHYHPNQVEDFTVMSGELTIRMKGQLLVLKKGDTRHIPMNSVHSMWNNTGEKTVVNWKIQPALITEYFFETAMGLANDGKTDKNGMPNIFQLALMAIKFSSVIRIARPPFKIQKAVFMILTPIAYVLGYKPTYKKYLN